MTDELTYMTDAQKAVIASFEKRGFGVMEEIDFPPYRVDIYLPDYHAAIEVDGPQHEEKTDKRRDRELMERYGLYVYRIPAADAYSTAKWGTEVSQFLRYVITTKNDRWEKFRSRTPWL